MRGDTFAESGLAGACNTGETGDKVVGLGRDVEGEPGKLGRRDVDAGVHGEEVGFGVLVVRKVSLWSVSEIDSLTLAGFLVIAL